MKTQVTITMTALFIALIGQISFAGDNYFPASGNVGIGTTSPGTDLTVTSSPYPEITIDVSGVSAGASVLKLSDQGTPLGALIGYNNNHSNSNQVWLKNYDSDGKICIGAGGGTSEHLTITSSGKVGIGTASPGTDLTVTSSPYPEITIDVSGVSAGASVLKLSDQGTPLGGLIGYNNNHSNSNQVWLKNYDSDGKVCISAGGGTSEHLTITSSGKIGMGDSSPSHPLQMGSGAYVSTGGVWVDASSREYKEKISDLASEEALVALQELTPKKYFYKTDEHEMYVGFIAEDVPDLLATKDRKGLSPMEIVAVLTKVVQGQQKKISELEKKLTAGSNQY